MHTVILYNIFHTWTEPNSSKQEKRIPFALSNSQESVSKRRELQFSIFSPQSASRRSIRRLTRPYFSVEIPPRRRVPRTNRPRRTRLGKHRPPPPERGVRGEKGKAAPRFRREDRLVFKRFPYADAFPKAFESQRMIALFWGKCLLQRPAEQLKGTFSGPLEFAPALAERIIRDNPHGKLRPFRSPASEHRFNDKNPKSSRTEELFGFFAEERGSPHSGVFFKR